MVVNRAVTSKTVTVVIVTSTTDIPATPLASAGEERYLVDFLNTLDVEDGTDVLENATAWRRWSEERGLTAGDVSEARRIRDALRALVSGSTCELPDVALRARATPDGVILTGDTAAGEAVAIAATLTTRGRLPRVKLCPCDDCGWAFYDASRNGSRTWCDMAVCGNRVKAKTFREKAVTAG
ncbi:MAG: hypothetical protein JWP85_903 [Rhodoglobus sp.]|nr:hypothetical protein [Rhodoglobus sp.]